MKEKILIVDDSEINRELLGEILGDSYEIRMAENGKQVMELVEKNWNGEPVGAILLDLMMPEIDGFAVLRFLREKKQLDKIPVLVISGETDSSVEKKCFDCGVTDFIGKPFNAAIVRKRVENAVAHFSYKNHLEEKVQEQTRVLRRAYQTLQIQAENLKTHNQEIVDVLGAIVEFRSAESGEHIQRVKGYTMLLAREFAQLYPEYGLDAEQIRVITSSSALHDIGKIAIPDSILLKPGRLTDDEFEYMKSHTLRGCEILESMENSLDPAYRKVSYDICRHHHERYDGKGYPDHLKGDDIPLSAQLVSVADVYDALINERCYKAAYSKEEAFHMIVNGECGVFSPKMMKAFRVVRPKFEEYTGLAV